MDLPFASFQFDVDRLLSPIAAHEPTGQSLRYEGTYDQIASLRREEDPALAQGDWVTEVKRADWQRVAQACLLAIETRSKDVQIAAWLLEAWIHLHGLAGVREGLRVISELCDTYWDGLHPQIEGEDFDYRLAPFTWIDEKLAIQIALLPLTCPQSDGVASYSLADWETATRQQGRARPAGDQAVTQARFQQSLALTSSAWLSAVASQAGAASEALEQLGRILDDRCGRQAPSFGGVRRTLESIGGLLSVGLQGREEALPQVVTTGIQEPGGIVDIGHGADPDAPEAEEPGDRHIRTRGEAYRRLSEAADFLMRTEPHSPVPHLVRRAIAWGALSLEELLPELVSESSQLSEIYRLLQLRSREPPK
jgi:type VI secretion system protein ImpA